MSGAVTDGAADLTTQALTGDGTINWGQVGVRALGGGAGGAADHHFSNDPPTLAEPTQLAVPAGRQPLMLEAGETPEMLTVYRGTSIGSELDIHSDTGAS